MACQNWVAILVLTAFLCFFHLNISEASRAGASTSSLQEKQESPIFRKADAPYNDLRRILKGGGGGHGGGGRGGGSGSGRGGGGGGDGGGEDNGHSIGGGGRPIVPRSGNNHKNESSIRTGSNSLVVTFIFAAVNAFAILASI